MDISRFFCISVSVFSLFGVSAANASSADAFNKFIDSSPAAKALLKQVAEKEEISAGCMYSASERHQGFTISRNGNIYEWSKTELDSKNNPNASLLKVDKKLTDRVFDIKEHNGFDNAELDYTIDGTSYCYVRAVNGSRIKMIVWPMNEIMGGGKKVPESAREVFDEVINTGAIAMGLKNP